MTPTLPDLPTVETHVIELTNRFRQEHELSAVKPNAALTIAARAFAAYLAKTGKFSHTADGRNPADRTKAAGYEHCSVGENLALNLDSRGFASKALASQAVEGWKNSPGHRRNMLGRSFTEIGVGVVRAPDADPKFISVQLFGRPRALAYKFEVANFAKATVTYSFGGKALKAKPNMVITHTSCEPGDIVFTIVEPGLFSAGAAERYEAGDGKLYRIRPGKDGSAVEIDVGERKARR